MPKRKNSRQCATPGCKLTSTLFPHCQRCRTANCGGKHEHTHYDSNAALVCDDCGATVTPALKRKGRNMVGKSVNRKAPWVKLPQQETTNVGP
jgi:hypothetical protein